jgi:predicted nuclease of predicted toxin-antitoxin system
MRLLADENFDNNILRALVRRRRSVDIVRIQDVAGLGGADDPTVLEWAATEGRVLLTHDVNTIPRYAHERTSAGKPMPGVVILAQGAAIGPCVQDLLLLIECSADGEWEGQVLFLPL